MSVLNQSGEEQVECPLCMEPLEVDDLHFYPCTCGYQICRFCWNRIREGENGLCPACRKAYPENPADFTPLSQEQVAAIKTEKKAREQKKRNKTLESRKALANVRVVQNNLVFVVGLPVRLADPEILKRQEYFGKYGKIHKVVINQSTSYAGSQGPSASAYVTYVSPCDALRAIQGVNNVTLDGRVLKGSLGTTKYCANFMKNQPCPKPDCMYLHELGDPLASFTKEEMHAGLHQVYERKLHQQLLQRDQHAAGLASSTNAEKGSSNKDGNQSNFIPTTVVTSSNINIVNSSKSKSSSSGASSSSSSSSSSKEAWPSLGASPPADSPARKLPSPQPIHANTVTSQENGTSSESSSPVQSQTPQPQVQAQSKNKESTDAKPNRNSIKDNNNSTNTQNGNNKKNRSEKKQKANSNEIDTEHFIDNTTPFRETPPQEKSVFENTEDNYLSNELDELESDRHSLLENHDLLDNSDHSLLEDSGHSLLNEINNEMLMMQRHRDIMPGLIENNHLMQHKNPLVNGYGLLDRDSISFLGNDRHISNISQGMMDQKELLLRERSRSEMLMRQNEMLGRQHNVMVEPKHYLNTSSIGLESASELLGANYHPNPNILPPFGMRIENSMAMGGSSMNSLSHAMNGLASNSLGNGMGNMTNSMGNMTSSMGNMTSSMGNMTSSMGNMTSSMGNMTSSMGNITNSMGNGMSSMGGMNGLNANNALAGFMLHNPQLLQQQQMQQSAMMNGFDGPQGASEGRYLAENMDKFFTDFHKAQQLRQAARPALPRNALSAERLEYQHKQRMSSLREANPGGRAAGDCDDDLDFDPFKETQKALAEMIETEMMHNTGSRLPPPGFSHLQSTFGGMPRHPQQQQGWGGAGGAASDWSRLDPAIVCGARWPLGRAPPAALPVPLPPGFAPSKPAQRPHECVDAN